MFRELVLKFTSYVILPLLINRGFELLSIQPIVEIFPKFSRVYCENIQSETKRNRLMMEIVIS